MSPPHRWHSGDDADADHDDNQNAEHGEPIEIPLIPRQPAQLAAARAARHTAPPWEQRGWSPQNWQRMNQHHGWSPSGWDRHRWQQRSRQRQRMFLRFIGGLLFFILIVGGAIALVSHIIANITGQGAGEPSTISPFFFFLRTCGMVLIIPIIIIAISSRAWRSWAAPLADIMDAAEEVATGNLQVRVHERGSREFQRLANSFNRMTEELARTDQQRRNLTADVAHELRTPLHIIQGNLEGILDGVYLATPEHIEATLQETRTLSRLVDDLRTLSLAESGQLPMHPEDVDVHDLLADVATSFSPLAESAGIELSVEVENNTPATLYGDPGRLDQVLSNLVGNALRHTPPTGRITLTAAAAPKDAQSTNGQVQLTVTDSGEGIPSDDLPFIFDRFWRGDRARTHKEGTGSGLGLAITAQLVRAHGGTINVTSTPGEGTTFTIKLPTHPPEDPTPSND